MRAVRRISACGGGIWYNLCHMNLAELLSPAGDFETALAAFDAGADAVYCGLADFSARAFAKNFDFDSLSSLVRLARQKGRKVYVTFNTIIYEEELEAADSGVDQDS